MRAHAIACGSVAVTVLAAFLLATFPWLIVWAVALLCLTPVYGCVWALASEE